MDAARIPSVYRESVLDVSADGAPNVVTEDPNCVAALRHYRSLMPMAQEALVANVRPKAGRWRYRRPRRGGSGVLQGLPQPGLAYRAALRRLTYRRRFSYSRPCFPTMTQSAKKLIEVALPLEAINKARRTRSPSVTDILHSLHLWWARRPLAAARAVIFAQMVDDPSACPDLFPTEKAQEKERKRLFRIIEDLVLVGERHKRAAFCRRPRDEISAVLAPRLCCSNADHPQAKELFDRNKLPAFHDPFAGGGCAARWRRSGWGLESLCQRPEPGGRADQQGDDRDPAQVRRQAAGQPRARRQTRPV